MAFSCPRCGRTGLRDENAVSSWHKPWVRCSSQAPWCCPVHGTAAGFSGYECRCDKPKDIRTPSKPTSQAVPPRPDAVVDPRTTPSPSPRPPSASGSTTIAGAVAPSGAAASATNAAAVARPPASGAADSNAAAVARPEAPASGAAASDTHAAAVARQGGYSDPITITRGEWQDFQARLRAIEEWLLAVPHVEVHV